MRGTEQSIAYYKHTFQSQVLFLWKQNRKKYIRLRAGKKAQSHVFVEQPKERTDISKYQ